MSWKKIKKYIGTAYVYGFEKLIFVNWFNPLITLYLNFRSFPFSQAIKLPVFVYGWPRLFSLYGSMECVGTCKTGMIKINQTNTNMPSHTGKATEINNWGKILFHGKSLIYTNIKIDVKHKGILEIGNDTKISIMCNIVAFTHVTIGNHTRIAHRCQLIDSNNHFIADFNKHRVRKMFHPIHVGDYCWICNSSTLTGGAVIPSRTILASNSLVGKDMSSIPDNSIIGGVPAKLISSGHRRVENRGFVKEIFKFFKEHPDEDFYEFDENREPSSCDLN